MGLMKTSNLREEIPRVRLHPNAKRTPKARGVLVERVRRKGWPAA